jgi:hypothetical protein
MVKPRNKHFIVLATLSVLMVGVSHVAYAQGLGRTLDGSTYSAKYKGISSGGSMCTNKMEPEKEGKSLLTQSIEVNLDDFRKEVVNRIEEWGHRTADAIRVFSSTMSNDTNTLSAEMTKVDEAALAMEQDLLREKNSLEATQAMTPTKAEEDIALGLAMYRPDLVVGSRQAEMSRFINELNNVPLDHEFVSDSGNPLPGYVDTSRGRITAMGQEFRNFIRFFCDARSINGKLASTRFQEYDSKSKNVTSYWCGSGRGVTMAPPVVQRPASAGGGWEPLEGDRLTSYINQVVNFENAAAQSGTGKSYLINAPKNVAHLYFEPHTLNQDKDIYEKAEQQFARFVIGRANDINNTADFNTGEGQRAFMEQQSRTAKLALARYPFAEMFSQKIPTMPEGSAIWAAELIEENIGNCKSPDPSYASLCELTKQLRQKGQISESEFFDVLFSRQFQGMAFSKKVVGMSEGQLRRLQYNLQGLQIALNYQRNRMKEQQLALMAAIYAHQNQ